MVSSKPVYNDCFILRFAAIFKRFNGGGGGGVVGVVGCVHLRERVIVSNTVNGHLREYLFQFFY